MSKPITHHESWAEIRSICSSAYEEYGQPIDIAPGRLSVFLRACIEIHDWTTCPCFCTQVLTYSKNESAAWDGGEPYAPNYNYLMRTLACDAMEADVLDRIDMAVFEAEEAS